jgi:hypothetical protein
MKNLKSYNEYIKEGVFTSDQDDLAKKIYDLISTMPDNRIEHGYWIKSYKTNIVRGGEEHKSIDPYGEENWGENRNIEIFSQFSSEIFFRPSYIVNVNEEDLECSLKMKIKIYNLMKKKYNRYKKETDEEFENDRRRRVRGIIEEI